MAGGSRLLSLSSRSLNGRESPLHFLKKSAKALCTFCEASHCDKCQITYLMDDARDEAIDAGLITDC